MRQGIWGVAMAVAALAASAPAPSLAAPVGAAVAPQPPTVSPVTTTGAALRPVTSPAPAAVTVTSAAPPASGWVVSGVSFHPLSTGHPLDVQGLGQYRGSISVRSSPGGVAVVDGVGLEDYVRGISEVPPSWPLAALEAQAIAARTYALHEKLYPAPALKAEGADICASEACQVYAGVARDREPGDSRWQAAVAATAGQIVQYQGQPILAMYSSSNGGRTVAGGEPYLPSVPDPDDLAAAPAGGAWQAAATVAQVDAAVGTTLPVVAASADPVAGTVTLTLGPPPPPSTTAPPAPSPTTPPSSATPPASPSPPPTSVPRTTPTTKPRPAPTTTTTPPRSTSTTGLIKLTDAVTTAVQLPAQQFVNQLDAVLAAAGQPTLQTTRFTVSMGAGGQTLSFTGLGRGHGIGMSQYGALGKAEKGMAASGILAAYYGGLQPSASPPGSPTSINVELADDQPAVTVDDAAPFSVADGHGGVLAPLATGGWRVLPAPGGRVRVLPPPGQGGALAATVLSTRPGSASSPAVVRVRLNLPAAVAVSFVPSAAPSRPRTGAYSRPSRPSGSPGVAATPAPKGGPALKVAPGQVAVVGAGEQTLEIPVPSGTQPQVLVVQADAGDGRVVTVPVRLVAKTSAIPGRGPRRRRAGPGAAYAGGPNQAALESAHSAGVLSGLGLLAVAAAAVTGAATGVTAGRRLRGRRRLPRA